MKPKMYKLKSGEVRWRGRVEIDGVHRNLTARTKDELEAMYIHLKADQRMQRRGMPVEAKPITYGSLIDTFMGQYREGPAARQTLEDRLVRSRDQFGGVLVSDLTVEAITRWNADVPTGATYRGHVLTAMRRVLAYGVECGYITANPAKAARKPREDVTDIRPFESWDEVCAVAEHLSGFEALPPFACGSGLRPQEWIALDWKHVDLQARTVTVARVMRAGSIEDGAKTRGSRRVVRLQLEAADALDSLARPIHGGLVFTAPEGGPINLRNFGRRQWKRALKAAKLEARPPGQMRHTFASLCLAEGVSLEWISRNMGHTSTLVTEQRYSQWIPRADEHWLDVLDAASVQRRLKADQRKSADA